MKAIKEIMAVFPLSCGKDETLETVADRMFLSDANFLPVVDENKKVIGTVTYLDVCLAPEKKAKPREELRISDIMNPKITTVSTYDDEALALNLMRTNRLKTLTVVDHENRLSGTVNFITVARRILSFKNELKSLKTHLQNSELV